jgi:cobalt-zinc-cadmium efflux system protein
VGLVVLAQSAERLIHPPAVASTTMIIFGLVGLLGNSISIAVLASSRAGNLNLRAAFLEVVNDAVGSAAVLVAAVVIALTGWRRVDAVASLLISLLIVPRTWTLLRETVDVLMERTPRHVDLVEVRKRLTTFSHVINVHDLHASTVSTGLSVLTAHVVVDDSCFLDGHAPRILEELQRCLLEQFKVNHTTLQLESGAVARHQDCSSE